MGNVFSFFTLGLRVFGFISGLDATDKLPNKLSEGGVFLIATFC
ncbi:hypothetical protein AwWohl_15050 [Gammaproteobacteria bacterium]|nr:hypothetical protein AwWohl_15050 [Gammaproteobacteria bacterium]